MSRIMHFSAETPAPDRWQHALCGVAIGAGFPGKGSVTWAQVNCPECLAHHPRVISATPVDPAGFGQLLALLAEARATTESRPAPLAEHHRAGEAFDAVVDLLIGDPSP